MTSPSDLLARREVAAPAVDEAVDADGVDGSVAHLQADLGQGARGEALDDRPEALRVIPRLVAWALEIARAGPVRHGAAHVLAQRAVGHDAALGSHAAGDPMAHIDQYARLPLQRIVEAVRAIDLQLGQRDDPQPRVGAPLRLRGPRAG